MTTAVQHRRGTTAEHSTFTGLEGEVTIDTTKDTAVIHDGSLAGGYPLAKETLANVNPSTLSAITGAATASDDLFLMYDTSALAMKKISRAELNNAITIEALDTVDINGGTIDGTAIGGTTPSTGKFTTLTTTGNTTLGDASTDTVRVNGYMGVGVAPVTNIGLYLAPTALTGATGHDGIYSAVTGTASATARVAGFVSQPGTATASYTTTDVIGIRLRNATKGAGSTITKQHGAYIDDQTQGTNNYGITSLVSSGTNKWNIYASGTAANYFAGNVGIGTSSPNVKLDVNGGDIRITDTFPSLALNGTTGGVVWNFIEVSSGNLETRADDVMKVALTSSGNLGLGVTPSAWSGSGVKAFDIGSAGGIAGSGSDVGVIANAYYNGSSWIYKTSSLAARYQILVGTGSHAWFTAPSGTAGNAISFTQAMTLDSSGRLGIGTSSPSADLHINGTTTEIRITNPANTSGFDIGLLGGSADDNGYVFNRNAGSQLIFGTANTERARIDSSGRLLINNTAGTTFADAYLQVYATGSSWGGNFDYGGSTSGRGALGITLSGGSTVPDLVKFTYGSGTVGTIRTTGTAVSYNTASDYRLKENIQPMTGALAKVTALKPVTYNWKADGSDGEGFIAHELAEVVPACVTGVKDAVDAEGNPVYQGIDTSFLVATLTAAIQELKAEFDAYKATHP